MTNLTTRITEAEEELEQRILDVLQAARKTFQVEQRGQRYRPLTDAESWLIYDFNEHVAADLAAALARDYARKEG